MYWFSCLKLGFHIVTPWEAVSRASGLGGAKEVKTFNLKKLLIWWPIIQTSIKKKPNRKVSSQNVKLLQTNPHLQHPSFCLSGQGSNTAPLGGNYRTNVLQVCPAAPWLGECCLFLEAILVCSPPPLVPTWGGHTSHRPPSLWLCYNILHYYLITTLVIIWSKSW